jgi:hypothetical protein
MTENPQETQPIVSALDLYNTPRAPGDINLVELIADHISSLSSGNVDMVNSFKTNNIIATVYDGNQVIQRTTINRYLTTRLLIYRSMTGAVINHIYPYIANQGLLEDWVTLLRNIVLPFFIANNIFLETLETTNNKDA